MAAPIEIRILRPGDEAVMENVGAGVFDHPVDLPATRMFLADPMHHLAVAIDGGSVVGFASAVHYFHPDRPAPELWINEVGVATSHRERGLGKLILGRMIEEARSLGCAEAWVITDRSNRPALRLYAALGGAETPHDQVVLTFRLDGSAPRQRPR